MSSTTDGTIFRGRLDEPAARVFLRGRIHGRDTAVGIKVAGDRIFVAGGSTGRFFVYGT